jgi:hypothetical protein
MPHVSYIDKNWRIQWEEILSHFLFYPLSFASFSPISFIIFFSVLPTICKREQDREKLRKIFLLFFSVVVPWVGVAQAQGLAGLALRSALAITNTQKPLINTGSAHLQFKTLPLSPIFI